MTVKEFIGTYDEAKDKVIFDLTINYIDGKTHNVTSFKTKQGRFEVLSKDIASAKVRSWTINPYIAGHTLSVNMSADVWKGEDSSIPVSTPTDPSEVVWVELNWTVYTTDGKIVNENLFSVPKPWLAGLIGLTDETDVTKWLLETYGEDDENDWSKHIYTEALADGVLRRADWA